MPFCVVAAGPSAAASEELRIRIGVPTSSTDERMQANHPVRAIRGVHRARSETHVGTSMDRRGGPWRKVGGIGPCKRANASRVT